MKLCGSGLKQLYNIHAHDNLPPPHHLRSSTKQPFAKEFKINAG